MNFSFCCLDEDKLDFLKIARSCFSAAGGFSYLLLSSDSFLVPLPPGWVVDVQESFISCGDAARSEQLQRKQQQEPIRVHPLDFHHKDSL